MAESESDGDILDEKEEEYKTNSPKIFKKNSDVTEKTPNKQKKRNSDSASPVPDKIDFLYTSRSAGGLDAAIEADLEARLPMSVLTDEDDNAK